MIQNKVKPFCEERCIGNVKTVYSLKHITKKY